MRTFLGSLIPFFLFLAGGLNGLAGIPDQPWFPKAPPLPKPSANAIIRELAKNLNLPLADFHSECIRRRPEGSWDGTLISRDGVHPSGGKSNDYSEANLQNCGYALRNWVNFLVFRQLYFRVFNPEEIEK